MRVKHRLAHYVVHSTQYRTHYYMAFAELLTISTQNNKGSDMRASSEFYGKEALGIKYICDNKLESNSGIDIHAKYMVITSILIIFKLGQH